MTFVIIMPDLCHNRFPVINAFKIFGGETTNLARQLYLDRNMSMYVRV